MPDLDPNVGVRVELDAGITSLDAATDLGPPGAVERCRASLQLGPADGGLGLFATFGGLVEVPVAAVGPDETRLGLSFLGASEQLGVNSPQPRSVLLDLDPQCQLRTRRVFPAAGSAANTSVALNALARHSDGRSALIASNYGGYDFGLGAVAADAHQTLVMLDADLNTLWTRSLGYLFAGQKQLAFAADGNISAIVRAAPQHDFAADPDPLPGAGERTALFVVQYDRAGVVVSSYALTTQLRDAVLALRADGSVVLASPVSELSADEPLMADLTSPAVLVADFAASGVVRWKKAVALPSAFALTPPVHLAARDAGGAWVAWTEGSRELDGGFSWRSRLIAFDGQGMQAERAQPLHLLAADHDDALISLYANDDLGSDAGPMRSLTLTKQAAGGAVLWQQPFPLGNPASITIGPQNEVLLTATQLERSGERIEFIRLAP